MAALQLKPRLLAGNLFQSEIRPVRVVQHGRVDKIIESSHLETAVEEVEEGEEEDVPSSMLLFQLNENFDQGSIWADPDDLSRSFSARFAVPSTIFDKNRLMVS
ncbi:UNVERIFIED_CONTAM: hypothetical protein Sindi_0453000 [Sesamum indicum]